MLLFDEGGVQSEQVCWRAKVKHTNLILEKKFNDQGINLFNKM